jgi:hypothetical protein
VGRDQKSGEVGRDQKSIFGSGCLCEPIQIIIPNFEPTTRKAKKSPNRCPSLSPRRSGLIPMWVRPYPLSLSHRRWAQGGAAAPPTVELPRQPHRLRRRRLLPPLRRTRRGARLDGGSLLHSSFPSSEIFRTIPMRDDLVCALLNADLDGSPLVHATSMVAPSYTVLEAEALLGVSRRRLRSISSGSRPSSVGLLSATSDDGNGVDRGLRWCLEVELCGSTLSGGGSGPSGCGSPPLHTVTVTTAYPDGGSFSVRTAMAAPPSHRAPVMDVMGGSASDSDLNLFFFLKIDFGYRLATTDTNKQRFFVSC